MKAMLMSDLLIAKKYLPQQLGVALVVGLFITFMIGNLYIAAPMVAVMVPFSLTIMIMSLDERANWQQFRLALPISRTDVITGRYASFALLSLLGVAVGFAITLILIAAAQLLPSVQALSDLMVDLSWQAILFTCAAGLIILLFMLSLVMPLFSRFGMTKGVRYVPLLIIFGVFIAFSLDGNGPPVELLANINQLLETPLGTIGLAAGLVAVVVALYVASAALSVKLYAKRQL